SELLHVGDQEKTKISEFDVPPVSKELKKRWSYFIRKVHETSPLICPKCQGEMRIISFIDRPGVIKKILRHQDCVKKSHARSWKRSSDKRDYPPIRQVDKLTYRGRSKDSWPNSNSLTATGKQLWSSVCKPR